MRPIDKGSAPRTYNEYGKARHDLANRIGYYCSYCEMSVKNMIEVEHIVPVANGGNELDWNNFLLSCKYCNTIKSDNNCNMMDYLWPNLDNTDLAFEYSKAIAIQAKKTSVQIKATNTINLMGLDRIPGGVHEPTEADTRWRSRLETWNKAKKSLERWVETKQHSQSMTSRAIAFNRTLAEQIGETALNGHYSIWTTVFQNEPVVLDEIDKAYKNQGEGYLYKEFDEQGNRIKRNGASI